MAHSDPHGGPGGDTSGGPPQLPLGAADLLLVLILGLGGSRFLLPILATLLHLQDLDGLARNFGVLALLGLQSGFLLFVVYLVAIRWRGATWRELGFVPLPAAWRGRAVVIALLSFPLVGLISYVQQEISGAPLENPQMQVLAPPEFSWVAYLGTLAVAGVLAPVAEEAAFRGLLFRWLAERYGFWFGLVASALAFSFLHGIAGLIPAIAVLGAILAWVYARSHSIWAAILVHGLYNAVVTTVLYGAIAQGIKPPGM